MPTRSTAPTLEERRAAWAAEARAKYTPKVPGIPGDGTPLTLHRNPHAAHGHGLTYTWHDRSPDLADASPRESGIETSLLTATTDTGTRVAHLRVSFTTRELLAETFPTPFHWADENTGATFGFRWDTPTPAHLWVRAHEATRTLPASWDGKNRAKSWSVQNHDVPEDPAVIDADLAVLAAHYRRQMSGFLRSHKTPFVAYSHVDNAYDAHRATAEGRTHPGDLRRTGVGTTLYVLAAQQLATTGRILRASGNRSPEADALWASLIANPTIATRKTRHTYYLTGKTTTGWCLDYRTR